MLFPISLLVLVFSSVIITAQFRIRQKPAFLLAILLTAFTQIVLIAEAASLLHLLTLPFFLFSQALILTVSGYLWMRRGKPGLLGPWTNINWHFHSLKVFIKQHPLLSIWVGITALLYILQAALILLVPQNNYDSMTYHLSRIGYWLQHHSLAPWPTPNPRQTTFPMNAELAVMWTVMFSGGDRWAGFIQWLSVGMISLAGFGIARMLGARRSQALFTSLLFSNFTGILLQSSTTQNDLVVSALLVTCLYFLFLAKKETSIVLVGFSGLAIGLAVGTKSTIAFVLPAFAICILIDLVQAKIRNLRFYLTWGAFSLAAFLLVGAFGYIQNQIAYQNPLSDKVWTEGIINTPISRGTLVTANTVFYTYQMLDFSAIPEPVATALTAGKSWFFTRVIHRLNVPAQNAIPDQSLASLLNAPPVIHEDTSWYGLVAFLVLIPAAIYQLVIGLRRGSDPMRWMLVVMAAGFVLTFSAFSVWSPYKGRYFILPIALVTPLTYFIYSVKKNSIWAWLIAILSIFLAVNTVLNNPTKALVGQNAVWGQDRLALRTLTNRSMQPVLQMVAEKVPENAVLATRLGQDDWDYPLFGDHLQRNIVQLDPRAEKIDVDQARSLHADYLLLSPMKRTFLQVPAGLEFTAEANGWLLFKVLPEGASQTASGPDFTGLQDAKQLIFLDAQLRNRAGVIAATSRNWGVETYQGHGVFWIGEKSGQGLQIYLWAEETLRLNFTFQLAPGGGLPTPQRSMAFTHWLVDPYLEIPHLVSNQPYLLTGEDQAMFSVDLRPGLNKFILYCKDEATIRSQPNGDQRPLMVLVNRVDVTPETTLP